MMGPEDTTFVVQLDFNLYGVRRSVCGRLGS